LKGFNPEVMDGYLGIGNLIVASPNYRYKFDSMVVTTVNDPGKHMLEINSSVLAARYEGSLALDKVGTAIKEHLNYYLERDSKMPDTTSGDFVFIADVKPHPVFSDLLLPDLKRFSGININTTYSSLNRKLELKATSPQIIYGGYNIRDLNANINSNASSLTYNVGVSAVQDGSINLPQTTVSGNIANGTIDNTTRIIEKDSGDRLLIRNDIQLKDGTTTISIKDGRVVFDNRIWTVPADNKIVIAPGGINIRNLVLANSGNQLGVQSETTVPGAPMDVTFTNFNIGELSQIIENDTPLVRGALNGKLHIKRTSPFEFTSDLEINELSYQGIAVGEVSIKADNLTGNRYTAMLQLKGNDNDVVVKGYYENEMVNFNADVNSITLKALEAFMPSQLRDAKGYVSGNVAVTGKASKPDIKGKLRFNDAEMTLVAINNRITIARETVSVDEKGIHFGRFTVKDQSGQPLILSGDVLTTDFTNMKFNVDIRTQNFTVLNTTSRNNKEYYGKIIINSNIKVRGTQDLPVIDASVKLIEGSSFTYVVQQGDLSTDIGADIVQVIDKDTNIFFKFLDTAVAGNTFKGIDLSANIQIDRRTVFTVIVDPNSGDKLVVAGDAILNFSLDQSGKMSLGGTYTLKSGSYRASFQKVVKKEFFIQDGSSITWAGDPTAAKIDITAIYNVRTSAADLLAADVSAEERNTYRKLLDYRVNLIIKGELLRPELTFKINLSEDDRNAFGGMVESKLNAVNNDPNELNKQVFALLILNKFLPPSNAASAGGAGTSNVARNSVNQVLSDQLNALSGRYIKGGELNFNIQSNDDYGTQGSTATQENTEVEVNYKQQLFNERLSVQVGGNVNVNDNAPQTTSQQNITGDVVVEYKITDDGRYRFKAFRENNYEGLIDGMLYKTGVGIMYNRDYDNLKELFSPPKKEDTDEDITKRKDKKNRKKRKDKQTNE
ncbi:MAG: translocation/assembly module TamB domain-containing protein, partial [Bacteroidota bacterium]